MITKYLLYARKSTDEDDRQVLSIESQLAELHEFARRENFEIVREFIECRTAKEPGRPVFNEMIVKLEKELSGHGILAWHPDRLARNSIDGGTIIHCVDRGIIGSLKFPSFWFENTPQGKFMLNISFGQSKYFVDNLSENVRRGIRQKIRRGEKVGLAPIGYINDLRTKTIVKDPHLAPSVLKLFEAYSTGDYTLEKLQELSTELNLVGRFKGKTLSLEEIRRILQNPVYYGLFFHGGELHQGNHEPIITKRLYDEVQRVLQKRGKPRKRKVPYNFAYLNTFHCGECGRAITAEKKVKKSGLTYIYYRCTKKGTTCTQKYLEERELIKQVDSYIDQVALPDDWADGMLKQLNKDAYEIAQSPALSAKTIQKELALTNSKLERLTTAYIEGSLELEEYQERKKASVEAKAELKERMGKLDREGRYWLEPMRRWILSSKNAKIHQKNEEKRKFLMEIGSNFILALGRIRFSMSEPYRLTLNFKNKSLFSDDVKDLRAQDFKVKDLKAVKTSLDFSNRKGTFQIWSG